MYVLTHIIILVYMYMYMHLMGINVVEMVLVLPYFRGVTQMSNFYSYNRTRQCMCYMYMYMYMYVVKDLVKIASIPYM